MGHSEAHWIWFEKMPGENSFMMARRRFHLAALPAACPLCITAEFGYKLFVNGAFVCRGPVRSVGGHHYYDTADLAPYLTIGENVLAVLAYARHASGPGLAVWSDPLAETNPLNTGLPASSESSTERQPLDTGLPGWRVCEGKAWARRTAAAGGTVGFQEVLDMRRLPVDWTTLGFDDADWPEPISLEAVGPYLDDGRLTARDIPVLSEDTMGDPPTILRAFRVIAVGEAYYVNLRELPDPSGYLSCEVKADRAAQLEWIGVADGHMALWLDGVCRWTHEPGADGRSTCRLDLSPGVHTLAVRVESGPWSRTFSYALSAAPGVTYFAADATSAASGIDFEPGLSRWVSLNAAPDLPAQQPNIGEENVSLARIRRGVPCEARVNVAQRMTWEIPTAASDLSNSLPAGMPAAASDPPNSLPAVIPAVAFDSPGSLPAGMPAADIDPPNQLPAVIPAVAFDSPGPLPAVIPDADIHPPSQLPAVIPAAEEGRANVLLLDLGREYIGYPILTFQTDAPGAVVDIAYGELLINGRVRPSFSVNHFADRVTLRAGIQTFESSFWWKGCRYIQIESRSTLADVTVVSADFRHHRYPVKNLGQFRCSDETLNAVWEMGVHTMRCCMADAYMDCPSREQAIYLGDAVVEFHAGWYCFGDSALAANLLRQFVRMQNSEGFFGRGPGNILDQNLDFVVSLELLFRFTGDRHLLAEFYPAAVRLLGGFERYLGEDALVRGAPGSCWIDHELWDYPSACFPGANTGLNLRYREALRVMSSLAEAMGLADAANRYAVLSDRVRDSIRAQLYDSRQGLFLHALLNGQPTGPLSRQFNYLALLYDVAQPGEEDALYAQLTDNGRKLVETHDPFFYYYIHRVLDKTGRTDTLLENLRGLWGALPQQGLTTFPEGFDLGSCSACHAYSCTPNVDVPEVVLGVRPLAPGFALWALQPHCGDIEWAEGAVPTPHGAVNVRWSNSGGKLDLRFNVPEGTTAQVTIHGCEEWCEPGNYHVVR